MKIAVELLQSLNQDTIDEYADSLTPEGFVLEQDNRDLDKNSFEYQDRIDAIWYF